MEKTVIIDKIYAQLEDDVRQEHEIGRDPLYARVLERGDYKEIVCELVDIGLPDDEWKLHVYKRDMDSVNRYRWEDGKHDLVYVYRYQFTDESKRMCEVDEYIHWVGTQVWPKGINYPYRAKTFALVG